MKVKIGTLVTAEMLRKRGAGCHELSRFQAEWPKGAEVTLENLLRAAELDLDLLWWVLNCLPAPLRAALARQMAPLWAALACQVAPLQAALACQAEFCRQVAPFRAEFYRQVARLIWQLLKEGKCQ